MCVCVCVCDGILTKNYIINYLVFLIILYCLFLLLTYNYLKVQVSQKKL